MPCVICGRLLLLYNGKSICPHCSQLQVLDSTTATNVASRMVKLATKVFNEELRKWERDTLLGNLVAKRELASREFFKEFSLLKIARLGELTLLMKRVVKFSNFSGKIPSGVADVDKLLHFFEGGMDFETILSKIKSGYSNILPLKPFDENSFVLEEIPNTFRVVSNETYLNLEKTYANHNIFPEQVAEQKFQEFKKNNPPIKEPVEYELLTPQDFIKKHYEILNSIFVSFQRNRILAECFDLEYLEKILAEPRDLIEFISGFADFGGDVITLCPTHKFIKRASKYFALPENEIKKSLVFDVNNKNIFPLFVRFRNEKLGDVVCITKDYSRFIYTILHAIITKDLFDKETQEISKKFENEIVKVKFQQSGYFYKDDIKDKKKATLQIDGLAVKNERCYVVECKGWRFPRLIDEPETRDHIERELKGIILGEEYSSVKGKLVIKPKPSLPMKVNYVRQNIPALGAKYGFDSNRITKIEGLVVTIDYPPVSGYQGVQFKSVEDIVNLF